VILHLRGDGGVSNAVEKVVEGVSSGESMVGNGLLVASYDATEQRVRAENKSNVPVFTSFNKGHGWGSVMRPEDFSFGDVEIDMVMMNGAVEDSDDVGEVRSNDC
jgi:hypothetical protein